MSATIPAGRRIRTTVELRQILHTEQRVQVLKAELGRHPTYDDACWILRVRELGFDAGPLGGEAEAGDGVVVYALDQGQRKAHLDRLRNMQADLAAAYAKGDRDEGRALAHKLAAYRGAYLKARPGYATTVHKSQGSTWGEVYVIQGDILKNSKAFERNRLLYVAFSRAARRLVVYG